MDNLSKKLLFYWTNYETKVQQFRLSLSRAAKTQSNPMQRQKNKFFIFKYLNNFYDSRATLLPNYSGYIQIRNNNANFMRVSLN